MKYEDDKFIIYYNDCDKEYVEKLVYIVKSRMPKIISFFKIDYTNKINIKLYDSLESYKSNLELSFLKNAQIESEKQGKNIKPREYQDWMIANTEDGNVLTI